MPYIFGSSSSHAFSNVFLTSLVPLLPWEIRDVHVPLSPSAENANQSLDSPDYFFLLIPLIGLPTVSCRV